MKRMIWLLAPMLVAPSLFSAEAKSPNPVETSTGGDLMLADYFRTETAVLAERCLADIQTLDDWKAKREEYRRQLQEMLGLWPMSARV